MKRILGLFLALSVLTTSFAAGTASVLPSKKPAKINAADVLIPIGKTGQQVSLLDLSHMKVREVESLTGQKMKLADKIGFKMAQKELARSIADDGTIDSQKLNKLAAKKADGGGFHIGGFALGFFLGLIGVLIAYLINDDLKRSRVKWAWLGLLTIFLLDLILIVAII
jgi:hypothetical protein